MWAWPVSFWPRKEPKVETEASVHISPNKFTERPWELLRRVAHMWLPRGDKERIEAIANELEDKAMKA